jgi:hypothetical protein
MPVNTGIGVCTPVEAIRETLDLEELMEERDRVEEAEIKRREEEAAAEPDHIEADEGDPEFTREKFLADLERASRPVEKRPKGKE